jgi:hypothetical protein
LLTQAHYLVELAVENPRYSVFNIDRVKYSGSSRRPKRTMKAVSNSDQTGQARRGSDSRFGSARDPSGSGEKTRKPPTAMRRLTMSGQGATDGSTLQRRRKDAPPSDETLPEGNDS